MPSANPLLEAVNFGFTPEKTEKVDRYEDISHIFTPDELIEKEEELYRKILTHLDACWWQFDSYPTALSVQGRYGVTLVFLQDLTPRLNLALENRGLPPVEFSRPKSRREGEFPEGFIAACNIVCDTLDKRAVSKKLQGLSITTKQWQAWLADEKYYAYYRMRIDKVFNTTHEAAKLSLTRNVESGDLQSIKYYMELANIYRPNEQTLLNLGVLVGRLMEILPRYLGPQELVCVADEFEQVLAIETTSKEA